MAVQDISSLRIFVHGLYNVRLYKIPQGLNGHEWCFGCVGSSRECVDDGCVLKCAMDCGFQFTEVCAQVNAE